MPLFIDHHAKLPPMPPEVAEQMRKRIQSGERDQFGSKGVNIYMAANGEAWCLSDAPTAEAVLKTHRAAGVPLEAHDIAQVNGIV